MRNVIVILMCLVAYACHPVMAKDRCTEILAKEYQQEMIELSKSGSSSIAKKIAKQAIDYEFEQKWLDCKQMENSNE